MMDKMDQDDEEEQTLRASPQKVAEEKPAEFQLCGRRIRTTVRGRLVTQAPLVQAQPDSLINGLSPQEAKYKMARDHRKQLERAVKLEEFHEKRINERIQSLELMKDAEVRRQEELERKHQRRQARSEQLKKDLMEGVNRKLEQEAEERKKQEEAEEAKQKEQERAKRYHKAQKAKLEKWHEETSQSESLDPVERAKAKRREQQEKAEQARAALEQEAEEHCPVKRLEVNTRIRRQQEQVEERPFAPPKQHDLPKPVLQMLDEVSRKPGGSAPKAAAPKAGTWVGQAKGVSRCYGLTNETFDSIENQFQKRVKGLGRLANYDDSKKLSPRQERTPREPATPAAASAES